LLSIYLFCDCGEYGDIQTAETGMQHSEMPIFLPTYANLDTFIPELIISSLAL